jgi:hypothetical protein
MISNWKAGMRCVSKAGIRFPPAASPVPIEAGAVMVAHAARRQVLDRCSRKAKVVLAQYQTSQSVNEGKLMFITM